MIVKNYACNICEEKQENVDELIGLFFDIDGCRFFRSPVEETDVHLCSHCLAELADLHATTKTE